MSDDRAPKPIDLPPVAMPEGPRPAAAPAVELPPLSEEPTRTHDNPLAEQGTREEPLPSSGPSGQVSADQAANEFDFNPFTREIEVPVADEPLRALADAPAVPSPFVDDSSGPANFTPGPPPPIAPADFGPATTPPPPTAPANFGPTTTPPPPAAPANFGGGDLGGAAPFPPPDPPPLELGASALTPIEATAVPEPTPAPSMATPFRTGAAAPPSAPPGPNPFAGQAPAPTPAPASPNPFAGRPPAPASPNPFAGQPPAPTPAPASPNPFAGQPAARPEPTPAPAMPNPFAAGPAAAPAPSNTPIPGAPRIAGAPGPSTPGGGPDPVVGGIVNAFEELQRGIKRLIFNKHRIDEYSSYLEGAFNQLRAILDIQPRIDLRTEVSTLVLGDIPVLEDDKRENNLIYPLWNEGVRLLVIHEALTLNDLLRFVTIILDIFPRDPSEDLLSALWKAELRGIEWVALNDFSIVEGGEEGDEVEVQVEEVLAFLQRSLSSESGEGVANARVNLSDLELQLNDVSSLKQLKRGGPLYSPEYKQMIQQELSVEEARLLDKICSVIFEVMRLPASDDELEDIAAALEQLLDGLVLQGKFGTINRVITFAEELAYEAGASTANRDLGRRISERLSQLIAQPERVRGVATALNAGRVSSLDELKSYLERLGPHAVVMLLEMLDMIQNPMHRRAVADALVELGKNAVPLFAGRIKKASSNLAKDLFYIIDTINPPDKATILEPILHHENAVLRMEVMNLLSKAHDEKALRLVIQTFNKHDIPQMRAHAARVMGQFPENMVIQQLIKAVRDPGFDERPPLEQRAVIATLAQMSHPSAREYVRSILDEKSGILKSRRVDERKLLLIKALSSYAGIPALKQLSGIAGDKAQHSKEVTEAAREAALKMRDRLQGVQPT